MYLSCCTLCLKLTDVPQDSLVTMVKPGLPTTADLYVLPQESTPVKRSVFVDKVDASFCLGCHSNEKRYILRQQNISLALKTLDTVT